MEKITVKITIIGMLIVLLGSSIAPGVVVNQEVKTIFELDASYDNERRAAIDDMKITLSKPNPIDGMDSVDETRGSSPAIPMGTAEDNSHGV